MESQKVQKLNNMFFADAVICFDKLWLTDCLLETYNFDSNTQKFYMK